MIAMRLLFMTDPSCSSPLQMCCNDMDVDIISIDMTQRVPYYFKRQSVSPVSNILSGRNYKIMRPDNIRGVCVYNLMCSNMMLLFWINIL